MLTYNMCSMEMRYNTCSLAYILHIKSDYRANLDSNESVIRQVRSECKAVKLHHNGVFSHLLHH
jgi:hypothetical protein